MKTVFDIFVSDFFCFGMRQLDDGWINLEAQQKSQNDKTQNNRPKQTIRNNIKEKREWESDWEQNYVLKSSKERW